MKYKIWLRALKDPFNSSKFLISNLISSTLSSILFILKKDFFELGSRLIPITFAPKELSQRLNQPPLNPVWPVINTVFSL